MKKIWMFLALFSLLWIAACTKAPSILSEDEVEEKYHQMLTNQLQELSSYFNFLQENNKTETEIQITFPSSTTLQWKASYASSKHTVWKNEAEEISFDIAIQNFWQNTPLLASGQITTHYIDQTMHINIHNFNLFMGEGNIEANFINLLAQQVSNKRIILDQQENIGIAVVEIPTIPELIASMADLYDNKNFTYQTIDNANILQQQITALPPQHLSALKEIIDLATNFINLPISTNNLTLQTEKENTMTYTTKKQTIVWERKLYYQSDESQFSVTTFLSPEQITMEIKDIRIDDTPNSTEITLSLTKKKNQEYILDIKQTQEQKIQQELSLEITLQQTESILSTAFKGKATINHAQLVQGENIQIIIQWTKTFQNAEQKEITITGEKVNLSALLE